MNNNQNMEMSKTAGLQIDLTIKDGWYVISVGGDMIARVPSENAVEKALAKYLHKT